MRGIMCDKMKKLGLAFIFSGFIILNVFAQENWNRYAWGTPDREGFTVLLPTIPEQVANENGEQGILADSDFVTFNATFQDGITKAEFDKKVFEWVGLIGGGSGTGTSKAEREREINLNHQTTVVSICGYSGIEFGNTNSVQRFFLIDNRLYHVWITGANKSNPNVAKSLNSFTLVNPWKWWKGIRANENLAGLGNGTGSGISFESSVCKNIGATQIKKDIAKQPTNSTLKLISKPKAIYPEEAKKNQVEGTVTLKVTFLKDGTIGDISVVKGINKELNESAIKAAKLIRFEPERKKGKPLTITRSIQYTFMLY